MVFVFKHTGIEFVGRDPEINQHPQRRYMGSVDGFGCFLLSLGIVT